MAEVSTRYGFWNVSNFKKFFSSSSLGLNDFTILATELPLLWFEGDLGSLLVVKWVMRFLVIVIWVLGGRKR